MTTTLNTSRSENTMVLSARVSACMYFLVVEVENSKIYGYSYDSLCASDSDTVNL